MLIPNFWKKTKLRYGAVNLDNLVQCLHLEGINIRYLALVREHATEISESLLALEEMVLRTLKQTLQHTLRMTMLQTCVPIEEQFRTDIYNFINVLSDRKDVWNNIVQSALLLKFGPSALTNVEKNLGLFDILGRKVVCAYGSI